jgi:hypothetical protein
VAKRHRKGHAGSLGGFPTKGRQANTNDTENPGQAPFLVGSNKSVDNDGAGEFVHEARLRYLPAFLQR